MSKLNRKAELIAFVASQRQFVAQLESRKYEAAPYLRLGHERTLAEARALLTKAEAAVGR